MTPAAALALLRESQDGEPARIFHDHGRTVTALAHDAGVSVDYVHVDLTKQTSERRIVEAKEESHP